MSDNFLQISTLGSGTTTASATLTGVTAGSTLVAFCLNGSNPTPTVHSVSDGTAYTAGPSAAVALNTFGQVFYLQNAGAGSHTATFTSDTGNVLDMVLVEIGTTAGASAFLDAKANSQTGLAAGQANLVSSGSLTVGSAATIAALSTDCTSAVSGDEPTVGTTPFTFTSRQGAVSGNAGAYRVETAPGAANGAATFGTSATATGHDYVTLAIAIANAGGAAQVPYQPNYARAPVMAQ